MNVGILISICIILLAVGISYSLDLGKFMRIIFHAGFRGTSI